MIYSKGNITMLILAYHCYLSANMPLTYWSLAFATSIFLITRLPTTDLSNISPYQKIFNLSPNYQNFRTFGCVCFHMLRLYASNKLENRSTLCILLAIPFDVFIQSLVAYMSLFMFVSTNQSTHSLSSYRP